MTEPTITSASVSLAKDDKALWMEYAVAAMAALLTKESCGTKSQRGSICKAATNMADAMLDAHNERWGK